MNARLRYSGRIRVVGRVDRRRADIEASDPALNGPDTRAFIALLPNARFAPTVAGWEDTGKAVSDAMQSVYLGKAQPAAALNAAAEKANQSLGK